MVVSRVQRKKVGILKHFLGPLLEFFIGAKLRVSVGRYYQKEYRGKIEINARSLPHLTMWERRFHTGELSAVIGKNKTISYLYSEE